MAAKVLEVGEEEIRMSRAEKFTTIRYIIWHYMHYKMGKSISELSHLFHYSPRTVFYGINKIKNGMLTQKYYRDKYDDFIRDIVARCQY